MSENTSTSERILNENEIENLANIFERKIWRKLSNENIDKETKNEIAIYSSWAFMKGLLKANEKIKEQCE